MSNSDTFIEVIKLLQDKGMTPREVRIFLNTAYITFVEATLKESISVGMVTVNRVTGDLVSMNADLDTPEMNQKIIEALQKNILEISPTEGMQA